ncbi:acyltransferase, partial [bacterium]|nr:acyltransferase [bacterium]
MTGLAVLGLLMLAVSSWFISAATLFPGPWALLPVIGTLLLLLAGSDEGNPVARLLSIRPAARVGDWSYSIYLWHWPLIVFAVYLWPTADHVALAAAALSLAPAIASYHWLEQPIRGLSSLSGRRGVALVAVVILPALATASLVGLSARFFWEPRYAAGTVSAEHPGDLGPEARFDFMKERYFPCSVQQLDDIWQEDQGLRRCLQSKPGADVDFAVLGDSHAENLFVGLAEALPDANVMYVYLHNWPDRRTANATITFSQVAERPSIKSVLVTAYWADRTAIANVIDPIDQLLKHGKTVYIT